MIHSVPYVRMYGLPFITLLEFVNILFVIVSYHLWNELLHM